MTTQSFLHRIQNAGRRGAQAQLHSLPKGLRLLRSLSPHRRGDSIAGGKRTLSFGDITKALPRTKRAARM